MTANERRRALLEMVAFKSAKSVVVERKESSIS
jgi:hypothetical protein